MSYYVTKRVEGQEPGMRAVSYHLTYARTELSVPSPAGTVIAFPDGHNEYFNEYGNIIPPQSEFDAAVTEWRKWNPGIWP
jgi:hypothetical protein